MGRNCGNLSRVGSDGKCHVLCSSSILTVSMEGGLRHSSEIARVADCAPGTRPTLVLVVPPGRPQHDMPWEPLVHACSSSSHPALVAPRSMPWDPTSPCLLQLELSCQGSLISSHLLCSSHPIRVAQAWHTLGHLCPYLL